MRMKRTTGLMLSLALMVLPATAALAKPVADHHVAISWYSSSGTGSIVGSMDVRADESGTTTVDYLHVESRMERCSDGSFAPERSESQYRGVAPLTVLVERSLETIELSGDMPVHTTVTSTCPDAAVVHSDATVTIQLSGLSTERPVRARDKDSGARMISRWHDFVLIADGVVYSDSGWLTKTISRA